MVRNLFITSYFFGGFAQPVVMLISFLKAPDTVFIQIKTIIKNHEIVITWDFSLRLVFLGIWFLLDLE